MVTRIALKNYKSIAACDVRPAALSFLVGPNGCGKSNFLDALRFVAEAVRCSLDDALRARGGMQEVRRRAGGQANHFGIRLDLRLPRAEGWYAFEVAAKLGGRYGVRQEECAVEGPDGRSFYRVVDGQVVAGTIPDPPAAAGDRLYLAAAAGLDGFRPLYEGLCGMAVYNPNPAAIRELQAPAPGAPLQRDGGNLASVLSTLERSRRTAVEEYLAAISPGIRGVAARAEGGALTLDFRQEVGGARRVRRFPARDVSDGTLHALGVLVALFQGGGGTAPRPTLIGIEEPEGTLHPAAAGVLIDSFTEAGRSAQIIVTTHSPDLLDTDAIADPSILAVHVDHAETRVGPLDEAARSAIHDHLFTAGELLRKDQLRPDPAQSAPPHLDLFEPARLIAP